ncbi:cytochrome c family protein [Erythrobacter longus]|uniref:Cytochrome c family protein n=1 Tax=Erythrobacter longus TaxID=1044 RepID=A0A074M9Q3_ERYLO|nr:cytochrome c3 family protein [Erythrobacter longus]KEO90119.1 cytochrome c family protein [Erythrobacter longus]
MAFLIRTIAVAKSGREIVRDRRVEKDELIIGRDPASDIHLPDLTVELQHLKLTDAGKGMVAARALGELPFNLDGTSVTEARIDPDAGAEIAVGPALLAVSRDADGSVQIIIKPAPKDKSAGEPEAGFLMASAMPSKRAMAWTFFGLIFVLLLSVPVITHQFREKVENDPENLETGSVLFDASWSTGDLSMAHHDLEDNCEACHQTAFVSVQDETCITCHEELDDHAKMDRQLTGMAPFSTGDQIQWDIGQALGKEGPLGCVSCHTEHEGPVKLEASTEKFCADCHNDMDARLTDVAFSNAGDFGEKHPQFRPKFYTAHFDKKAKRVSLDDKPVEKSGLVFPHDIHVSETGGAAKMALSLSQYGAPLECSDCHEEDKNAPGGFKPVVMEDSCEACHSLVSGTAGGAFTKLRHGDVTDLMEDLAKVNLASRRTVVTGRGRPGQYASSGRYYANFGRPMTAYIAINRALQKGGTCGDCHLRTTTDGRLDLIPVNIPDKYIHGGFFPHEAHGDDVAECKDCHATETSGEATDLLIPDLESCRDCHLGETAVKTEEIVPSGCAMCHGYHTPAMPWKPADHPDLPGNGGNDNVAAILSSLRR